MDPVVTINGGMTIQTNDSASQTAPVLAAFFPPSPPPPPPQAILSDTSTAGEPLTRALPDASVQGVCSCSQSMLVIVSSQNELVIKLLLQLHQGSPLRLPQKKPFQQSSSMLVTVCPGHCGGPIPMGVQTLMRGC